MPSEGGFNGIRSRARGVDGRVPRTGSVRTASDPEGSSAKDSLSGAAASPDRSRRREQPPGEAERRRMRGRALLLRRPDREDAAGVAAVHALELVQLDPLPVVVGGAADEAREQPAEATLGRVRDEHGVRRRASARGASAASRRESSRGRARGSCPRRPAGTCTCRRSRRSSRGRGRRTSSGGEGAEVLLDVSGRLPGRDPRFARAARGTTRRHTPR